ncbi:hypothetical protein [Adhaeribacter terreus]|uniref:STAS/SEC14 domain-containing protein n=1 Tax=Adhaeribacter terreus TaxID=529703 RepID=A0ABW0EH18_9BACT
MILEEDSLFDFIYDPKTDILTVRFPDAVGTPVSQIENSLQKLAQNAANYDVKKLLLDISSGVPGLDEEHYHYLVEVFLKTLSHSRIQKIARVIPENPAREYLIDHIASEMYQNLGLPFIGRSFTSKAEACAWLQEP